MLLVFAIVLCVGLASSRPNEKAIVSAAIDASKYCACTDKDLPQCGCCVDLEELIEENYTVCANLTYVESEFGIRFTLMINGEVLINKTLSGKNPPPLCRGIIDVADFCVKIYNISYEEGKFGGCLELYADLVERVLDLKLGCWYMEDLVGIPVAAENIVEVPVDEKAKFHSLFQVGNSAKEQILDEMHKWSHKDGELGVTRDIHKDGFPEEPFVEEYDHEENNDSF